MKPLLEVGPRHVRSLLDDFVSPRSREGLYWSASLFGHHVIAFEQPVEASQDDILFMILLLNNGLHSVL